MTCLLLLLECRDGRTPLHEMAIRGEAPTVLLLATEAESEWASGSAGDTDTRASNSTSGDGGTSLGTSSNDQSSTRRGARPSKASDDGASDTGQGFGPDDNGSDRREEVGRGTRLPSSSSAAVAPLDIVVDEGVIEKSGGVRAGSSSTPHTSSVGGEGSSTARKSRRGDDGLDAPAPSCVRTPLPLSNFAAPSLADTDDFYDHHRCRQWENAGIADAVAGTAVEEGAAATEAGATEGLGSTDPNINKLRAGRSSSDSREDAAGAAVATSAAVAGAAAAPKKGRTGGSVRGSASSINSLHDGGAINSGGSEMDDSSDRVCRREGEGSSNTRGEGEEKTSGWEELLEVNVRCSESGNYPLHEAAASGSVGAVLSLLDLGAIVGVVNGRGDTALHVGILILDLLTRTWLGHT